LASGEPDAFPERPQRATRPHKSGVAYWIEHAGSVWLVRRPVNGVLGGMAALPGTEWKAAEPELVNAIGIVRHVFTHFSLNLAIVRRAESEGEGWWHPLDRIGEAGLPTLYRKAADVALAGDRLAA
jgi:A/G-specific adenine glycosylase